MSVLSGSFSFLVCDSRANLSIVTGNGHNLNLNVGLTMILGPTFKCLNERPTNVAVITWWLLVFTLACSCTELPLQRVTKIKLPAADPNTPAAL